MQPVLRWKIAVALVVGVFLIGCSGSDSESGTVRDEGAADVAEGDTTAEDISAVEDSSTAPGEDACLKDSLGPTTRLPGATTRLPGSNYKTPWAQH